MKKTIYLLILTLWSGNVFSQYTPLISEGNTWKCLAYGWITQHFNYFIQGDTTIDLLLYKKVWMEQELGGGSILYGAMREDEELQRVYFRYNDTEALLYDFYLEEGDTASVYGIGMMHTIIVTSVSTIMVAGTERKKIDFIEEGWSPGYWIEGVGSFFGLADAAIGFIADYSPYLTCFYEGNDLVWNNPDIEDLVCSATLDLQETENNKMVVYPNPVSTELNLILPLDLVGKKVWVTIYNVTGELVLSTMANNGQVDISEMASGTYNLRLSVNERLVANTLFMMK